MSNRSLRVLDEDSAGKFEREGYLLCPGLLGAPAAEALNAALSAIIDRIGEEHAQAKRADAFWQQMPRSADGLEVFWMPRKADDAVSGRALFRENRVMRVGHALHLHDETFARVALRSPASEALLDVLGPGASAVQSAVVYKQPQSEAVQFGFHQDAAYLTCAPARLALAFVALDDADARNGALMVAPGSHLTGLGEQLRLGTNEYEHVAGRPRRIERAEGVLVNMHRGDVLLVHGLTYHASDPNRTDRPRRALIVHATASGVRMAPSSWVQEPKVGFARLEERATDMAAGDLGCP